MGNAQAEAKGKRVEKLLKQVGAFSDLELDIAGSMEQGTSTKSLIFFWENPKVWGWNMSNMGPESLQDHQDLGFLKKTRWISISNWQWSDQIPSGYD